MTVCSLYAPPDPEPHDLPASDAAALALIADINAPYVAICSWDEPDAVIDART